MRSDHIQGMPTWEASAREQEMVLRAYARRRQAEQRGVRWRSGAALLVLALIAALALLAPWTLEVVSGVALMAGGLLWLAWWLVARRQHHRFDVLAVLVATVALLEARKSRL